MAIKEKKKKEEELLIEEDETSTEEETETTNSEKDTKGKKAEKKEETETDKDTDTDKETSDELDFGIEKKVEDTIEEEVEETVEEEVEEINVEDLINDSKIKPDFKNVALLFLDLAKASNEEELITIQTAFEKYLKESLVPKVEKALGLQTNGNTKKAGVASTSKPTKKRITTPLKDRK